MAITIQVLSTSVETKPTAKGSYQQLEVAYKNLTFQGKVEAKKLMSFGANSEAFKALITAAPTSVWEVETVKNDKGYIDWIKVAKGSATSSAPTASLSVSSNGASGAVTKGNWETPEERAKKQVYIIRQSSLNVAVAALSEGAKKAIEAGEIIGLAKQLEAYVLDSGTSTAEVVGKDIESLEEDLPF